MMCVSSSVHICAEGSDLTSTVVGDWSGDVEAFSGGEGFTTAVSSILVLELVDDSNAYVHSVEFDVSGVASVNVLGILRDGTELVISSVSVHYIKK